MILVLVPVPRFLPMMVMVILTFFLQTMCHLQLRETGLVVMSDVIIVLQVSTNHYLIASFAMMAMGISPKLQKRQVLAELLEPVWGSLR